jgi:hypothetical protein
LLGAAVLLSACGAFPASPLAQSSATSAGAAPVIETVALERADLNPGDTDQLVVTLHSPGSGPARAVTVLSYPDGTQTTLASSANGTPLTFEWTAPAGMNAGTARYDVVVSQVCGCDSAASATWGNASGVFHITGTG